MDKRKITLAVIVAAITLVALVGGTYAFWTMNASSSTSTQASIQTGGLILRLDDVDGITSDDKIDPNHLSFSKYFSITNEGTEDAYAKMLYKGLTNTFVTDALVYELEEVQANKSSYTVPRIVQSETVLPKSSTPSNQLLADKLLIEKETITNGTVTPNTKYYKLTVKYLYSDSVNQDADLNKTLISGFTLEQGTPGVKITTENGVELSISESNINTTIAPNGSAHKSFTLRNTSSETQKVDVELVNVTNTSNDVTVSLSNDSTVMVNKEIPIVTNETVVIKKGLEVDSNSNDNYTITINNGSNTSTNISGTVNTRKEEKLISCVDASGNKISCPATFTMGDRIAIGEGANKQTFRYLRTTSTSSNLSECGTTESVACNDPVSGLHRFLAEYNLKRTGTAYSGTAIASDALQDPNNQKTTYSASYGASNSDYSQSYLKTYLDNYATVLNTMIGEANAVTVNALSKAEAVSLFGCPSGAGRCTTIPDWAKNSNYWLGSANTIYNVWYVNIDSYLQGFNFYNNSDIGARAVVNISASLF